MVQFDFYCLSSGSPAEGCKEPIRFFFLDADRFDFNGQSDASMAELNDVFPALCRKISASFIFYCRKAQGTKFICKEGHAQTEQYFRTPMTSSPQQSVLLQSTSPWSPHSGEPREPPVQFHWPVASLGALRIDTWGQGTPRLTVKNHTP